MKIKFLGTGSAWPLPRIGCDCKICRSRDKKDRRRRPSLLIRHKGKNILVDVSPDFYYQAMEENLTKIDMILITHAHEDHIGGLNEFNQLYKLRKKPFVLFTKRRVLRTIGKRFPWMFREKIKFRLLKSGMNVDGLEIDYLTVKHYIYTLGLIFKVNGKKIVYIPDCYGVKKREKIMNADILIVDATYGLGEKPNKRHFCLDETIKFAKEIGAKKTYLTHLGHYSTHKDLQKKVKKMGNFEVAYDGLEIDV